ncbi:PREDICTED: melanoma-associated antigen 10-like [Condylura cristata]|uniref:melanoma-associated antigen 10-like n=1 Tax=Condylura cristata TaxID=143302 RepID=UPI0003344AA5|nr:PREDICTED: melanoma-associated antigen 10-like [Condylura cristata]
MPQSYMSELYAFEEELQDPREAYYLEQGQLFRAEEEEELEASSGSLSSPSTCSSPVVLGAAPWSQSEEESTSSQEEEGLGASQGAAAASVSPQEALQGKIANLVCFLLFKYRVKELVTEAEMVHVVLGGDQEHFPVAFRQACECLQLVFGLEVQEANPDGDTYVVIIALGLTYDGLTSPEETLPKTGLLVMVLAVVLLGGDRASEAHVWEALGAVGVHEGVEHFIYGEPRELLTEVLVQEHYLEYRQVPHSDPPRYEFLWGPRAHAETSKVGVLDFFLRVNSRDPRYF